MRGAVALAFVLAGCATSQGSFGSYGSTRACYGDAVEAKIDQKLTGGAASWSEATTVCDFYNQHPNQGKFVDFWTTPQVYTPPSPGFPTSGGVGKLWLLKVFEFHHG